MNLSLIECSIDECSLIPALFDTQKGSRLYCRFNWTTRQTG